MKIQSWQFTTQQKHDLGQKFCFWAKPTLKKTSSEFSERRVRPHHFKLPIEHSSLFCT